MVEVTTTVKTMLITQYNGLIHVTRLGVILSIGIIGGECTLRSLKNGTPALSTQAEQPYGEQVTEGFTQSKLNANLLGLDCRAAFEKHYGGYYLKQLDNGEYASAETRKLWNCWWVSWDTARPDRQPKQQQVTEGEILAALVSVDDECRGFTYQQRNQWQATALLQHYEIRRK